MFVKILIMKKLVEDLSISMYCQICVLYDTCEKNKSCSCNDFKTNENISVHHKQNQ